MSYLFAYDAASVANRQPNGRCGTDATALTNARGGGLFFTDEGIKVDRRGNVFVSGPGGLFRRKERPPSHRSNTKFGVQRFCAGSQPPTAWSGSKPRPRV